MTVAADGLTAERLAMPPPTDLVVLDPMLTGCDGIEVLAAILGVEPTLPVIVVAAKSDEADRVEAHRLESTDYIPSRLSSRSF